MSIETVKEAIAILKDRIPKALYALEVPSRNPYDAYPELKDAEIALAALSTIEAEAIRRECARAARNAIFDFGIGDKASNYYSPMIRKELAVQLAERAILGSEPEKDKHGCLSCGRQCPNDCPQDGKA